MIYYLIWYFQEFEHIEVCAKILFQIELVKTSRDHEFGFTVEAELAEDTEEEDELCVFISELNKNGLAFKKGLLYILSHIGSYLWRNTFYHTRYTQLNSTKN